MLYQTDSILIKCSRTFGIKGLVSYCELHHSNKLSHKDMLNIRIGNEFPTLEILLDINPMLTLP